eukprot:gene30646-37030_t
MSLLGETPSRLLQWGLGRGSDSRHQRPTTRCSYCAKGLSANDVQLKPGACRLLLSPTAEEDRVWHEHMLRPQLYFEMCKVLSGGGSDFKVLQHFPETVMDAASMKEARIRKTAEVKKSILTDASVAVTQKNEDAAATAGKKGTRESEASKG